MNKKERIDNILTELRRLYPDAKPELNFSNPYETVIATMLSAQTTDKQVNKATVGLFAKYPDARALAAAEIADVEALIHGVGVYRNKAKNIVAAAKMICESFGGEVPGNMDDLQKLPGVGRKTANVVMANAFGADAIAVDTHVFRVSNRLGLAKADNVLDTEKQLMRAIPKACWSEAHHWLIYHGRRVCKARGPLCGECTLRGFCAHPVEM